MKPPSGPKKTNPNKPNFKPDSELLECPREFPLMVAGSLLIVLILTVLYSIRRRTQAVTGLVVLAAIMLVTNDNCPNDFNLPWIRWAGASPLMFMTNSVVLLIGYFGLHGIWPRAGILLTAGINACSLLLGLGHLTRLIC